MKTQLLKDRRPKAEIRMKTEIRKSLRTATEAEVNAPELESLRFDWAKPSGSRRSGLGLQHSGFGFLSAFGDSAVRFFTPILFLAIVLSGVAKEVDSESQRFYLSGHDKDDAVPWQFNCSTGAQSGFWTNIPVPSNWELHGFGTLNYHRDSTNPPAEQGRYKYMFRVPSEWSHQRIFLVFEGVMTDATAYINSKPVGDTHQGGYYRFKYDVTSLLSFDEANLLEVIVSKKSLNPSVNNAERKGDFWMYGGIYRPVYLEAVPQRFIERVAIDAKADGSFSLQAFVNGKGNATNLEAQIQTLDGKPVGPAFSGTVNNDKGSLEAKVSAPQLWTAETPNLYQVEVLLKEGAGVTSRYTQRFGFRTFEVREGDGLYLNGQRVVLKGCNRHSFWPDSGRCLSLAVHRLDVQTMKDMNMNAVRMSHYPPDAEFLDVCDELGLYVLDELAGWHWNYDNETGTKLVKEMVTRDVNHPSIVFWDNGNEGGFNTNLDKLFTEIDPQQRHVLHPWKLFGGVNTSHYLPYEKAQEVCQGPDIYMPTEFMHGLYDGGAGAGLEDYWGMMQNSKVLGGGFIWAFLDEGVKRADTGQIDVSGNEAPDGIVGPYRQKEGSFYTIKELWAPLVVKGCGTPPTSLTVENHYSFTDANQCKFEWQLRKFRLPSEKSDGYKVMWHGVATVGSIPPGTNGAINLALPSKWQRADALAVKASDPSGREIFTWVWPLPALAKSVAVPEARKSGNVPTLAETDDAFQVKTRDMTVTLSKNSGFLTSVTKGKQTFSLGNGPRPAESEAQLVQLQHSVSGNDLLVKGTYSGALNSVTWRIRPDGWVQCDYSFNAEGPKDFFGVAFDYPDSQVLSKKWLGVGPYRVWKNRQLGGTLNVWKNDYNNTVTGWADWTYPEFKGCFADVRWLQLNTTEGLITIVPGQQSEGGANSNEFVQVLTPQLPPEKLAGKTGVSLPKAGLALLNAIPPVGSKFQEANLTGPQGQLAEAKGEYHGTVDFYFGKLP